MCFPVAAPLLHVESSHFRRARPMDGAHRPEIATELVPADA